jgi:hypothetical protein
MNTPGPKRMGVILGVLIVIIAQAFLPRMLDLVTSILLVGAGFYLGMKYRGLGASPPEGGRL